MSTVEKISQLSHRIFNTSLNEKNVARQSNPFAASNFQKNILTEDVFESNSAKENKGISFEGRLTSGSKRIYSMFVGSISDFGNRISEGIEAINKFGTRMKEGIVNTWNKIYELGNKEVSLDGVKNTLSMDVKDILGIDVTRMFGHSKEKEISKLAKLNPTTEVKPMLKDALSALENDMVLVA